MRLLMIPLLFLPLCASAQGEWERPDVATREEAKTELSHENGKYLEGAVSEVDGQVQWTLNLDVPDKNAQEIYDTMLAFLVRLTKEENQLDNSSVSLVNKKEHVIVASMREWLVFKKNVLSVDRTKFNYTLVAACSDNHLKVDMIRLSYKYEEERVKGGYYYKAEEWINDKNALNKKKTKLLGSCAKFRCKTIDRKDEIFARVTGLFK
ncbi:MAG: DUF4468 domain-containing protein [Prevotellaceae bacterium]|nr:DUF4468 domain-containing protein [Prevotella sp.]MDD7258446.1 DUF4468 domain-containing protein [Prevotellaceae bacterium]MDY6130020.1 DUF4468 domain-containing protein [Prevotella sp.]